MGLRPRPRGLALWFSRAAGKRRPHALDPPPRKTCPAARVAPQRSPVLWVSKSRSILPNPSEIYSIYTICGTLLNCPAARVAPQRSPVLRVSKTDRSCPNHRRFIPFTRFAGHSLPNGTRYTRPGPKFGYCVTGFSLYASFPNQIHAAPMKKTASSHGCRACSESLPAVFQPARATSSRDPS